MNFKVDDIVICLKDTLHKGKIPIFIKNKKYKIVNIIEIPPEYLLDEKKKKYKIILNKKRKTDPYFPLPDDLFDKNFVSLKQLRKNKIKNINKNDNKKYR